MSRLLFYSVYQAFDALYRAFITFAICGREIPMAEPVSLFIHSDKFVMPASAGDSTRNYFCSKTRVFKRARDGGLHGKYRLIDRMSALKLRKQFRLSFSD